MYKQIFKRSGFGAISVIFLVLLTVGIGVALYALSGTINFQPKAAPSTSFGKTIIVKPLGLQVRLKNGKIHANWDAITDKSLSNFTLIVTNPNTQEIIPNGRVRQAKNETAHTFTSLILPSNAKTKGSKFDITLRAVYNNSQTVYSETKSLTYVNGDLIENIRSGRISNRTLMNPFGLAGWVEINSASQPDYSSLFYKSGAGLKSSTVRWRDLEPVKGEGYKLDPSDPSFPPSSWIKGFITEHDNWCKTSSPQCIFIFGNPPPWALEKAVANGVTSECAAIDEEDFESMAAAAAAAVGRFGQNTLGLEFYNEPDFAHCYGGKDDTNSNGKPDYQDYATILKLIYEKVKEVNPNYSILMGRLAADPSFNQSSVINCDDLPLNLPCDSELAKTSGKRIDLINFLEEVLSYSQKQWQRQYFDYLDLHYYEAWYQHNFEPFHSNDTYTTDGGGIRGKTFWAKKLLETYGAADLPIIYSEIGWATSGYPEQQSQLTKQAEQVFKLYAAGLSAGVENLSWYCFGDPNNACARSTTNAFSLRLLDGAPRNKSNPLTPRSAFTAYQHLSKELTGLIFNNTDRTRDIEGYVFSQPDSLGFKEVLWSRTSSTVLKSFPTSSLKIIAPNGSITELKDGDPSDKDKKKNRSVTIGIISPVIAVWQ